MVVGASGGGLAAGISLAVKSAVPDADFYTAEPDGFDDTLRSFASGHRERNARMSGTICDALMTNTPGELTFPITSKLIGKGVTATDRRGGSGGRLCLARIEARGGAGRRHRACGLACRHARM